MVDKEVADLLKVLRDVSRDELTTKLLKIKENNDNHICHLFLEDYFKNKDEHIYPIVYSYEARCIVNIFPQYSVEYIQSMLETLGSEDNRVIIILRQLLKNEPINTYKLTSIPNEKYINKQTEYLNMLPQDGLSSDITQFHEFMQRLNGKSAFKRKSDVKLEPTLSKRKIEIPTSEDNCTTGDVTDYFSLKDNEPEMIAKENKSVICKKAIADNCALINLYRFTAVPNKEVSETIAIPSTSNYVTDYLSLKDNECETRTKENSSVISLPNKEASSQAIAIPSTSSCVNDYLLRSGWQATVKKDDPAISNLKLSAPLVAPDQESKRTEVIAHSSNTTSKVDTSSIDGEMEQVINSALKYYDLPWPASDLNKPSSQLSCDSVNSTDDTLPNTPIDLTRYETYAPLFPSSIEGNSSSQVNKDMASSTDTSSKVTAKNLASQQQHGEILFPSNAFDDILDLSAGPSTTDESDSNSSLEFRYADPSDNPIVLYDIKLVSKIMEMFPDASPEYIKHLCFGKEASLSDCDSIVQIILSNADYPKRNEKEPSPDVTLDLEEQVNILKDILPDADPNYLEYHAELYLHDKDKLKIFIANAIETKAYPTMKEYLRKQQLCAQVKQYTSDFHIEKFLEIIPDPETYFSDRNRKSSLFASDDDVFSLHCARGFLKNRYPTVPVRTINALLKKYDCLLRTAEKIDRLLSSKEGLIKTKRRPVPIDNSTLQNMPLLQEIAYLSHKDEIKQYLEEKRTKECTEKEVTKQNGLLQVCNCCYSDEVMPKNIASCQSGCTFCNECVKTSVEIRFGEGKLDFPCLLDCGATFSLQTLRDVLTPKLFSKMAQKKQLEEVKAAGIEELEMCPFCDFATIPAPGDKLFRCLNPECMKESCRQCKEPSHVPYRCDEIEKDDDVKKRTYIENKMTEALIRVCYKCGMKFIKEEGCNKMTCSCGAMMCYVCGKAVTDYKHFNGQGGDKYHLCPLYSDTQELHKEAVIKGAELAKVEIGVADDPAKLKIDPTADLHLHYKNNKHTVVNNIHAFQNAVVHVHHEFINHHRRHHRERRHHHHHE